MKHVYCTQNYWVLTGVLGVETRFGNWICFRPQVKAGEGTYSIGALRKS
jgi:hypothetical protein